MSDTHHRSTHCPAPSETFTSRTLERSDGNAGISVTAGTLNIDGRLRVRVKKAGNATTMADILRLVETAQARTAPVQRLADSVAGRFAVGVMTASSATLAFWLTAGPLLFPKVIMVPYLTPS